MPARVSLGPGWKSHINVSRIGVGRALSIKAGLGWWDSLICWEFTTQVYHRQAVKSWGKQRQSVATLLFLLHFKLSHPWSITENNNLLIRQMVKISASQMLRLLPGFFECSWAKQCTEKHRKWGRRSRWGCWNLSNQLNFGNSLAISIFRWPQNWLLISYPASRGDSARTQGINFLAKSFNLSQFSVLTRTSFRLWSYYKKLLY